MPEGHTIHRLARDQANDLGGRPVAASSPQGRFDESAALLDGAVLDSTEAHGKHLAHHYSEGSILYVHLGLIGKFRRTAADEPPRGAVRLRLEGEEIAWDLIGPMKCELIDAESLESIFADLGPDPLRANADPDAFFAGLSRRRIPIAAALLDQRLISGIGNVYRSELCFLCGIDPRRPARELSDGEREALWAETVAQLKVGLRLNRIVTRSRDELGKPLSKATADERLYAYKRDGEPCRHCGTELSTDEIGGRRVWWCGSCQT